MATWKEASPQDVIKMWGEQLKKDRKNQGDFAVDWQLNESTISQHKGHHNPNKANTGQNKHKEAVHKAMVAYLEKAGVPPPASVALSKENISPTTTKKPQTNAIPGKTPKKQTTDAILQTPAKTTPTQLVVPGAPTKPPAVSRLETISITVTGTPDEIDEFLRKLDAVGLKNPPKIFRPRDVPLPSMQDAYSKEDYAQYLFHHREVVEEVRHQPWPVYHCNLKLNGEVLFARLQGRTKASVEALPEELQRHTLFKVVLESLKKGNAGNLRSHISKDYPNRTYKTLVRGIYVALSWDPLQEKWMPYVGQMKNFTSPGGRWVPDPEGGTDSHHKGIRMALEHVLHASRETKIPSNVQLCDLAHASSIIDAALAGSSTSRGVYVFVLEEVPGDLGPVERQWIEKINSMIPAGYNSK